MEALGVIFKRMKLLDVLRDPEPIEAKRERVWHQACQLGKCRYAGADPKREDQPSVDSTTTCGGYHGQKYAELDGTITWRWRPCVRHLAWRKARIAWLATQRASSRRRLEGKAPVKQLPWKRRDD